MMLAIGFIPAAAGNDGAKKRRASFRVSAAAAAGDDDEVIAEVIAQPLDRIPWEAWREWWGNAAGARPHSAEC